VTFDDDDFSVPEPREAEDEDGDAVEPELGLAGKYIEEALLNECMHYLFGGERSARRVACAVEKALAARGLLVKRNVFR